MPVTKITTCCYCGARAALRLAGSERHELACATCGAPISKMKMLPATSPAPAPAPQPAPARPAPQKPASKLRERPKKKSRKRRKGLIAKLWDEVKDEIEDIFD